MVRKEIGIEKEYTTHSKNIVKQKQNNAAPRSTPTPIHGNKPPTSNYLSDEWSENILAIFAGAKSDNLL